MRCHFILEVIILPRQARDKHRENSKNERRFLLQTAFLGDHLAFEPALIALQKRAAAFSGGLAWTHSECMQLVSYRPGQQFATHTVRKTPSFEPFYTKSDLFAKTGSGQTCIAQVETRRVSQDYFEFQDEHTERNGGQRVFSGLVYLNEPGGADGFEGGATVFPALNISFTPRKGTMLFWRNVGLDMVPDPRTRHSGERVTAGCATQRVGATV